MFGKPVPTTVSGSMQTIAGCREKPSGAMAVTVSAFMPLCVRGTAAPVSVTAPLVRKKSDGYGRVHERSPSSG